MTGETGWPAAGVGGAPPRHGKQRELVLEPRGRDRVEFAAIGRGLPEKLQGAVAIVGLQGLESLLEQAVALQRPSRRSRLVGRRRNGLLRGNRHDAALVLRGIIDARRDARIRLLVVCGLNHARGLAGQRLLQRLEDQSRAVLARPEDRIRDLHRLELVVERFRLTGLSGGQGPADLLHQVDGLLPSGRRGTDRIGTGIARIELPRAGGVVLLSREGDPPRDVLRLAFVGAIGHPLLDGQVGQLFGLLQLAPLQEGLGLLHEHLGIGLAVFFRRAAQTVDFHEAGDRCFHPLGAVFIGCIADLLLPGLGHQFTGTPHVAPGQCQAGGPQQGRRCGLDCRREPGRFAGP